MAFDIVHAVEFSRIERFPLQTSRSSLRSHRLYCIPRTRTTDREHEAHPPHNQLEEPEATDLATR
ncbi:hypothetical protein ACFPRL_05700 [Pseudoclavibacter helvolus]